MGQILPMRFGKGNRQSLTLALMAALSLGCWKFQHPRPMAIERFETFMPSGLTGWEESGSGLGSGSSQVSDHLALARGTQVIRALEEDDYPVALRILVNFTGTAPSTELREDDDEETELREDDHQEEAPAFAAVTRATRDAEGPLGLPRHGVAFMLWDDSVLTRQAFNAEVFWIDGDRLVTLNRERIEPLSHPATLDIFDDGRFVLFAIDGETIAATVTPDQPHAHAAVIPGQFVRTRQRIEESTEMITGLVAAPRRGGDVVLTAPLIPGQSARTSVAVESLTLLRHVPDKTRDMMRRWESLVEQHEVRWQRPIWGHVRDAHTRAPIGGALLQLSCWDRRMLSNVAGVFTDTLAPPGSPEVKVLTVMHPDYPTTRVELVDPEDLSTLDIHLPAEGRGDLTLMLERAPGDTARISHVTLRGIGSGSARENWMPPAGPMVFRNLPAEEWRAEVEFDAPGRAPFLSEPFGLTDERGQTMTIGVPSQPAM
jgi:hypothetical protein